MDDKTGAAMLPAIAGGVKAKTTPFGSEQRYGEEELRELKAALEQGTLFYAQGGKARQLEETFAGMNGVRFAIACSSGTAAIHAALIAAGISPGDEVITSPITDMGTVIPILYQGAAPVFADLHPLTATLSPASVEAAVTPLTRAVVAVNLWGSACDLDGLRAVCEARGLMLIEDCAQAFGAEYKGCPVGTRGRIGCFSLNEYKHVSCGDGGIVITDDEDLALRIRLATDKSYNRDPNAEIRSPTFLAGNYRITELQGAVALAQIRKLHGIVKRRRRWCGELWRRLRDLPGIVWPTHNAGALSSWWLFPMLVQPELLHADADAFAAALRAEGLPAGAHYIRDCVYQFPVFRNHSAFQRGDHAYMRYEYGQGLCPQAEQILQTVVTLSINEAYNQLDLDETEMAIRKVAAYLINR